MDPATIGGKLFFCRLKSGIGSLTCAGVGVRLTAACKPASPNFVEGSLKVMRSGGMDYLRFLRDFVIMKFPSRTKHSRTEQSQ